MIGGTGWGRGLVLGGLACAALAAGCGGEGDPGPAAPTIGLQTPNSPLVTLRATFETGAVDDPAGKNGLNALTALMIGRGGTAALTYEVLTTTLYPWAASIGTQADKEVTTVIGEVHRDHLEPFYEIFRDLIIEPRFDTADFERNRDFLTNAIASTLRGNDDEELGKQTLNALLYEGHPYGATDMGSEQGLAAITLDDVRAFHGQRYTRGRVLVGVAALGDPAALGAAAARADRLQAVDELCQPSRQSPFPHVLRAREQVGVGEPAQGMGPLQEAHHPFLPNQPGLGSSPRTFPFWLVSLHR